MKMNIKKLFLLLIILFHFSLSSVPSFSMEEERFNSLLSINNVYKIILSNYYYPPSGSKLLNTAILTLSTELNVPEYEDYLSEDLNNEEAFREFSDVFYALTDDFQGDLEPITVSIQKSMIDSLEEEYSSYFDKSDYISIEELLSNNKVCASGFTISKKGEFYQIVSVISGSPAHSGGILSGDIIYEVNDINISSLSTEEVYRLFSSVEGEAIKLKLLREENFYTVSYKIKEFEIKEFEIKDVGENILYLKINIFSRNLYEKVYADITRIGSFSGLILDLRDSLGGDFQNGLDISRMFLSSAPIIKVKSNNREEILHSENHSALSVPLVVLINRGTMSSAEIVAASLKDNKRALLIGEKTFGKGLVQGVFPLEEEAALVLSIKEIFRLSGEPLNNYGVTPDFFIEDREEQMMKAIEILRN